MALQRCPECAKDVSSKAGSCPHCGVPLAGVAGFGPPAKPKKRRWFIKGLLLFLALLFLAVFINSYSKISERVRVANMPEFEHDGFKLGASLASLQKKDYSCGPFLDEVHCKKKNPGNIFGVPAQKVELGYSKDRLYQIFIGFSPEHTPAIRRALAMRYGDPPDKRRSKNVSMDIWNKNEQQLLLTRKDNKGTANITLITPAFNTAGLDLLAY